MSKKTMLKKLRLGKMLKQARRLPALVMMKTHMRIQYNKFSRDWKHRKMRIEA